MKRHREVIFSTEYQLIIYDTKEGVVRKYKRYGGAMVPTGSIDAMTLDEARALWGEGMA